jgi:4'-phosphopantetheinyl transferase
MASADALATRLVDAPPVGEAHVWLARLPADPAVLEPFRAWLAPEEALRMAQFRFAHLRHEYLLTRALCRDVLARCAGVAPAAWRFAAGPHGRPEIRLPAAHRGLRFNLSNAHTLVACVVARGLDCGIDVERVDRGGDLLALARRYFAPCEVAALAALPAAAATHRFFALWTLKEAYAKARGDGLGLPLDAAAFAFDGARVRFQPGPALEDQATDWQFDARDIAAPDGGAGHRLAVAIRTAGRLPLSIRLREWSPPSAWPH